MVDLIDVQHSNQPAPSNIDPPTMEMNNGAGARIIARDGRQQLEVFNQRHQLVFRFDPETGQTTLLVPDGDLRLVCERGDIEMEAAGAIRAKSREIDLQASHRVRLAVWNRVGKFLSRLLLRDSRCELDSNRTHIASERLTWEADEIRSQCNRREDSAQSTRLETNRFELEAGTIDEKSQECFREVAELNQLKAGRMRTIIRGLFQVRSKKAMHRAEDDFSIHSERVNLG